MLVLPAESIGLRGLEGVVVDCVSGLSLLLSGQLAVFLEE